jgi:N-acetylglucosaminyldiphosphoundecaprenol N-acetyl-beta-D-mannosaminyltransferase
MVEVSVARGRPPLARRAEILGCPLDPVSMTDTVALVSDAIEERRPFVHGSLNAAKVLAARRSPELRSALEHCSIVTADGQAVVWAARLLGLPVAERVTGIDLMEELLARAAEAGWSVYVLGAREEVLEEAVAKLQATFAGLRVVGCHHGYFSLDEEDQIVAEIAAEQPKLLFVALETPAKELFLERNVARLPPVFAMGVGGAVDVFAGRKKRAPAWLQRFGLEWLYRFVQDPRRLAGRYIVGNARFIGLLARELVADRLGRGHGTTA